MLVYELYLTKCFGWWILDYTDFYSAVQATQENKRTPKLE